MSDVTLDDSVMVRIRRDIAESEKLMAEREKLLREGLKLEFEGRKLQIDRLLTPVIAIGGLIVGGLGLLVAFARH